MIAEDNPADILLVREAFRHHNMSVDLTSFKDGEEMLRYTKRVEAGEMPCPDIVLLDLNLPRVSGHFILEAIRQNPLCARVPVVIVSSSDSPRDRSEATRLGATRYFCKPSDFDEFMKLGLVVQEVVERTD